MNFLNEWYPNRTLPERKEIIDGLKITNTNKPISRKVFPCPNDVFGEWIDSKCIIKYPHPDEKKDGEKVCDELDDYIFYSSVGSFDRSFFRMLRKYLSKDNQDRKKPRGCRLIFAASFKNGKVHDVMKSRNKGLIEIKSHLQELQILNKLSNPKNTELDFSWFKLEGYRLNTEEEMTKTHIDRLVTAEEVETYMKKHRGKKR